MKKLLLVSAVAALSVTTAQAATDVYGRVVADLRYADDGDVTLDNGSTRLGVKGSTPITANTDAIYQLEMKATIDAGSTDVEYRDSYIGLQNATAGTVMAGRLTTIDDNVNFTNPSDYWNSGFGYGVTVTDTVKVPKLMVDDQGNVQTVVEEVEVEKEYASHDAPRANNALAYVSPNFNGFTGMAMYQLDSSGSGSDGKDGGSYGVAGKYEAGNFKAGASFIDFKDSKEVIRVSAAMNVTPQIELSGAYQVADYDGSSDKENVFIVAGQYDVPNSPWAAYLEYDGTTNLAGFDGADVNVLSLGGTYAFNKAVSGRIYAGFEDPKGGDNTYGVGTGLTYKF